MRIRAGARLAAARPWGLFVVLSLGAGMLTPSGSQVFWHAVYIMGMKFSLARIGEWLSPDFQQPSATELWLLLVLALGLSGRVRSPLLRLVLLLSLVHLALKHQRNIAVLGRVAPFLIAAPSAPAPMITPRAAVEAAMAAGGKGKVLNEYAFGGFLIHEGIPVFIDGRADMYGDAFVEKFSDAMRVKERRQFLGFLGEHGFGWSLLAPGTSAIAVLDELPGWRRVYADDTAVVHVRADTASAR